MLTFDQFLTKTTLPCHVAPVGFSYLQAVNLVRLVSDKGFTPENIAFFKVTETLLIGIDRQGKTALYKTEEL